METITMEVSAEECKEIQSQREVKEQVVTIARQKKLLESYESENDYLKFQLDKLSTKYEIQFSRWKNYKKKHVEYIKVVHKLARTVNNCWDDGCTTKEQKFNLGIVIANLNDNVNTHENLEEWNGNMK
tara:strand:+ start:11687 stop:12070 length:384 start_codon:yes stop_codon:yes gene_type:complete